MTEIKGMRLTTLTVTPGEYRIKYPAQFKVDILNSTDGNLKVSGNDDFTDESNKGRYLVIPPGCGYNGLSIFGPYLYLSAEAAGCISIVRKG